MDTFQAPKEYWICKVCGNDWIEDSPNECPYCKSKDFEECVD